jgi:predicted transposase/invertase (TIGR01784 family)
MSEMETSLSFTKEIPLFMRLEELASYSALSPKQQMQYDDSFHNYVSYHGQMQYKYDKGRAEGRAEGRVEGRAEGRKEGRAEGIAEGKIATARLMKADGEPAEKIARYTGLTIEEIQKL